VEAVRLGGQGVEAGWAAREWRQAGRPAARLYSLDTAGSTHTHTHTHTHPGHCRLGGLHPDSGLPQGWATSAKRTGPGKALQPRTCSLRPPEEPDTRKRDIDSDGP
jgi:hypothetical protein